MTILTFQCNTLKITCISVNIFLFSDNNDVFVLSCIFRVLVQVVSSGAAYIIQDRLIPLYISFGILIEFGQNVSYTMVCSDRLLIMWQPKFFLQKSHQVIYHNFFIQSNSVYIFNSYHLRLNVFSWQKVYWEKNTIIQKTTHFFSNMYKLYIGFFIRQFDYFFNVFSYVSENHSEIYRVGHNQCPTYKFANL